MQSSGKKSKVCKCSHHGEKSVSMSMFADIQVSLQGQAWEAGNKKEDRLHYRHICVFHFLHHMNVLSFKTYTV